MRTQKAQQELQEVISKFFQSAPAADRMELLQDLLNSFVTSEEFPHWEKFHRANIINEVGELSRLLVQLERLNDELSVITLMLKN